MTPERELLLKAMVEAGKPVKPSELAARVGKQSGAIRKMLLTLKESGQVEQVSYGYWQAVTLAGNTSRKAVTVSGNTSGKAVTLPGKVKGLSDIEKARIAKREYNKAWNAKHPGKKKEYNKTWKEANPEKVKECNRKWNKANPDKVKARNVRFWVKKFEQAAKTKQGGNE